MKKKNNKKNKIEHEIISLLALFICSCIGVYLSMVQVILLVFLTCKSLATYFVLNICLPKYLSFFCWNLSCYFVNCIKEISFLFLSSPSLLLIIWWFFPTIFGGDVVSQVCGLSSFEKFIFGVFHLFFSIFQLWSYWSWGLHHVAFIERAYSWLLLPSLWVVMCPFLGIFFFLVH